MRLYWPFHLAVWRLWTRNYLEHGTKTVLVIQDLSRSKVQPSAAETCLRKIKRIIKQPNPFENQIKGEAFLHSIKFTKEIRRALYV